MRNVVAILEASSDALLLRHPANHPLDACLATSAGRLLLACARDHGAPRRLLPAGHVGGAPFDGLWRAWAVHVSGWHAGHVLRLGLARLRLGLSGLLSLC